MREKRIHTLTLRKEGREGGREEWKRNIYGYHRVGERKRGRERRKDEEKDDHSPVEGMKEGRKEGKEDRKLIIEGREGEKTNTHTHTHTHTHTLSP